MATLEISFQRDANSRPVTFTSTYPNERNITPTHGTSAIAPEAPQVEHYDFIGWDKDFTNVQSNLDVYAQYIKNTESINNIETTSTPCKVLKNGQIFILRGEKVFSVTGQEVR